MHRAAKEAQYNNDNDNNTNNNDNMLLLLINTTYLSNSKDTVHNHSVYTVSNITEHVLRALHEYTISIIVLVYYNTVSNDMLSAYYSNNKHVSILEYECTISILLLVYYYSTILLAY